MATSAVRCPENGQAGPGLLALVSVVLAVVLILLIRLNATPDSEGGDARVLHLYCAAGMRVPASEAAERYQEEYGVEVRIQYGGSGTLLSNLRASRRGDLYLAADDSYLFQAREMGLVREMLPLAWIRPMVAVRRDDSLGISDVDDLFRDDVRIAVANPDSAAVGRATRSAFRSLGRWKELEDRCEVMKPTVEDVANDVAMGKIDAAILWDATIAMRPELSGVALPELKDVGRRTVSIGVLESSEVPTAALRFARYLGAPERGLEHFRDHGFQTVQGDRWSVRPRLVIFSGAMLRSGMEDEIDAFVRREGVDVETVWDGCGVHVANIRGGKFPDAYVSCDESFMEMVSDRFDKPTTLTENDMVILVKKGNPEAIRKLSDLGRSGLRVGLGHAERSALGSLTATLLERTSLTAAVERNKTHDSATGDLLVNQVIAGRLDAVIVYRSNALAHPGTLDRLEIVEIRRDDAMAIQAWALGSGTEYPRTLTRLFEGLHESASRARFEAVGFRWIGPKR